MSWVKIDDQFFTHPKVLAVGKDGRALFIAGLCYSAGHLTDGQLPASVLPVIAAAAEVKGPASARRLVDAGLWHTTETGWEIHDYHDHQPTAEAERAKRSEVSRARSEAGKKGAAKRWGSDGNAVATGMAKPKQSDGKHVAPSPSPSPYPSSSPPTAPTTDPPDVAGAGAPTEDDQPRTPETTAALTIEHIARCDLAKARADGTVIRSETAWLTAAIKARQPLTERLQLAARQQPTADPVTLAEQIDPAWGPLDGGAARSAANWTRTKADLDAQTAKDDHDRELHRQAKQLLADDPDLAAELQAQAEADHPDAGPALIRLAVTGLAIARLDQDPAA